MIKMTIWESPIFLSIFLQWENLNALGIWHDVLLFILHRSFQQKYMNLLNNKKSIWSLLRKILNLHLLKYDR